MDNYLQYIGGAVGAVALTGAVAVAVHMAWSSTRVVPPVDLNLQSKEVPGSGGARQSCLAEPGQMTGFIYDDVKTLLQVMESGRRLSNDGPCLGYRGIEPVYHWLSYSVVIERAKNFASGLISIGMKPGQSTFIGIYSQNRVEWILTEQACYNQSAVIVPLYDTLGPNTCSFIINQAEINIVICDKEERAKSLLAEANQTPNLKHIIVVNEVSEEVKKQAEDAGVELHYFTDIEAEGKAKPAAITPPGPEDLSTVCYTSGTTGNPKGVMLTHANIVIDACANVLQLGDFAPKKTDVMSSILPLAHMLERLCQVSLYMNGGSVGFYRGDVSLLMEDLKAMQPTVMVVVPRLLNRIYDKVQAQVKGSKLKRFLLNLAIRSKTSEIQRQILRNNGLWDRLIFKQVREGLGGRVKLLVSGSAPLAGNVLTFVRCAMGCLVVEGYGQTECAAPCTLSIQGDPTVGHVGPPIPCSHIKLIDVPEMEYFASDNHGEICIKGLNVFKGYLKDPVKTAETLDEDGWIHTGDIGMWLPNGTLKVVDRKKHIFKLAQGEYIAPEKIENVYLSSQFVSQVFVHGESLQSSLVAIVVPDNEMLMAWCEERNISGSWTDICENKNVKSAILKDITACGKKAGLKSFEQVKDIYLHSELFTVDNNLLTPSMKTKRPNCLKYFKKQIEAMYQLLA